MNINRLNLYYNLYISGKLYLLGLSNMRKTIEALKFSE